MKTKYLTKKLSEICDKGSSNISQNQLTKEEGIYPIYGAGGLIKSISFFHQDKDYIAIIKDGAGIGRVSLLPAKSSVIGTLQYIIPKDNIDIKFLYYIMNSFDFSKYKNGSTIPHIYFKEYSNEEFIVPSLSDQKRIVKTLDLAFEKINKAKDIAEQNLKNSKEIFDSHLQNIFSGEKDGWENRNLKDIAEYFNGLTYSPKNVKQKGIIVLRSSNVQEDLLDFSDLVRVDCSVKEKLIVKDGDILMCSRNGSKRLVGKTAMIKDLPEKMTFGTFMMIIRSDYNFYLYWFFKSKIFKQQISQGENTSINQITRYMLDEIYIPFPKSITEQKQIVKNLEELREQTKKMEEIYKKKIDDLEELKKSILEKAFNGEL